MLQRRRNLLQQLMFAVLLSPVLAGAEPISSETVSPLMRNPVEITRPLDPAIARDCGLGPPAGEAGTKFKSCPAFTRDPELGFVPANWGVTLTGADLMAAAPDIERSSSRTGPGTKACVIDTGLRLENNPGAGSHLLGQNTGLDERGHGTHVAGIVSSSAHGVNPALKTVVLSTPQMTETELARRLDEAATNPEVGVINLSFAISDGRELTSAINRATEAGKWVVIAAGNRGVVNDPDDAGLPEVEDLPGVFIVGANSPAAGMPSHFSNHGPHVDFYAPGSQINSLNARANPGYIPDPGNIHMNGTSMAAPHATAVIATLKNQEPRLTPEEVKLIIEETGIKRGPPPGVTQLNPLLASETVRKMSVECPNIAHENPANSDFRACMGKAIQSVQAAEPRGTDDHGQDSTRKCEELEAEYARLRRAYFISRGGTIESERILTFLSPLASPSPPSAAEMLWFTPAAPTSGDAKVAMAWTVELTRRLRQARAIDPLSRDLTHALGLIGKYTDPPSTLTPSEQLALLPARKESVGTFIDICTPRQSLTQESIRYLAYPCTDFFQNSPAEFKESFYRTLESQIRDARPKRGVPSPFLEWISTDDRWLSTIFRVNESGWRTPEILLDHLARRSLEKPAPDDNSLFWIERLELMRNTPAPDGSPELNRALRDLRNRGTSMTASERIILQNNLRAILAICERNPAECRSKVGGPGRNPGSVGPSVADQNISEYQEALRKAILSDPTLAAEMAAWLGRGNNLAAFQNLFGMSNPLVPAILLAQKPEDIGRSEKLAGDWFSTVEEGVGGGRYCATGVMICDPASVIAGQMALIAGKSPAHAHLIRDTTGAARSRVVAVDSPLGKFRSELRIEIADSSELTTAAERRALIQDLERKYRHPEEGVIADSSALEDEAGPLLEDPALQPIYIDLVRRELGRVLSNPLTEASERTVRTALHLSSHIGKPMLGDTLNTLFTRAAAGAEDYLGDITRHFGALARDHAQDAKFLQSWFTTLKKQQASLDGANGSKIFVAAALQLAQTEIGSKFIQNDPAFLAAWTQAFKRSKIPSYDLTTPSKTFPAVLGQALAKSLPGSEQLAKSDLELPENGWIKTVFQAAMSHEPLLDIALAAYEKCPDDSLTKTTLRQAIAEGLRQHPSRISSGAGSGGILARDPDLRHMIWGELESSGGTVQ